MKIDQLGPPPIEPLSDVAWSRVERGLWARLDAGSPASTPVRRTLPRWLWLAVPAIAAAIAIVIGVGGGSPVLEPARVVSNDAPSSIAFGDAHVTLDPHSAVVLDRDGGSALLERGAAWFAIAPRTGHSPFIVRAGDTTVRVIGTRFRVSRSAEVITVEVEHGIVELQHHEVAFELRDGQRWSSAKPRATTSPAAVTPSAVVEPTDDPEPAPAIDPQVKPRPKRDPRPPVKVETKVEPAPETKVEPAPEAKLDRRAAFERLAVNEARDPRAAIAGYLELAKGNDAWAELSLFSAARLAHDREDARAKTLLERYIARYPHGANVDDARELLASVIR